MSQIYVPYLKLLSFVVAMENVNSERVNLVDWTVARLNLMLQMYARKNKLLFT